MNQSEPFEKRSPYERLEQARRKRLLIGISNAVVIFLVPFIVTVGIMLVNRFSIETLVVLILAIAIIPTSLIARKFAYKENTVAAGYLLLIPVMLIAGINGTIVSNLFPIVVITYVLCIIVAGMILGPRQGYVIAGAATIFYLTEQFVLFSGVLVSPSVSGTAAQVTVFVMTIAAFFFVAVISKIATQDLRQALDEATYDLLEANHKLALASEMKSQFTARTSHELRTPLSSIIVFTELAMRGTYGEITPKLKGKLGNVLGSARHLHNIINDLLDLAKIEAGELHIEEEPFAIYDLGRTIQTTMEETAHQKDLEFHVGMTDDLPTRLIGDKSRVKQIMLNLVSNAIKYAFPGKRKVKNNIQIKMERQNGHILMTVQDNGIGLPDSSAEFKRDSLGLKLVDILVQQQLRGELMYEVNGGTRFQVQFNENKSIS